MADLIILAAADVFLFRDSLLNSPYLWNRLYRTVLNPKWSKHAAVQFLSKYAYRINISRVVFIYHFMRHFQCIIFAYSIIFQPLTNYLNRFGFNLSCGLKRPLDSRAMRLYRKEPLKVSHQRVKFGGYRHCGSGDRLILVCPLISSHHVIKQPRDFMAWSPSR